MVDTVVAAVTASEEERGPSIHGPDARLERVQSRPRVAVTRRVKTFAAAEDVVEVVGGNDCVSAERCVDLAREEEEEEEEEGRGAEEIEVATYASARPIHRSIADALGAELRSEGIVVDEDSDNAADDAIDFFKSGDANVAVKEEATTREDSHELLEPVSERLAAALSRAVRSSNPRVTRVVLSVKAGSAGAVPRRDSDGSSDGSLNSARRRSRRGSAAENAYAVAVSASSWKIAVGSVGGGGSFSGDAPPRASARSGRRRASSLVLSG